MKKIIIKILHILSKSVVKRHKPRIVAITGSVGKTATKEAIFAVISQKFNSRSNKGNYNTEIGLPLSIIGYSGKPGKNPLKWLYVFARATCILLPGQKYPEILILEMGADKPGDIADLLDIITPDIGIITAISATHTEQFNSIGGIIREKGKLFRAVEREGWIIVNKDCGEVYDIAQKCDAKKTYIGLCGYSNTNVCVSEIAVSMSDSEDTGIAGLSFKLHTNGTVTPILLKGVIGEHQVYPALFSASCAQILGMHMVDVAEGLRNFNPQPGRMRVISGIKKTILVDDTYNSSPSAAEKAIKALASLSLGNKKYAVLGDMLELGSLTEQEHRKLGRLVAKEGIDFLICVGERARDIARGARKAKKDPEHIFEFDSNEDAGLFIQKRLKEGDVVLIKGSRGVHMEDITREIMAHPEVAEELLVC